MRVLDLFAGCGGLSYGLGRAGFEIVAGVDSWGDALITFEKNHPNAATINLDLSDFDPVDIEKKTGENFDVIVGGPPCQGFSISGKRNPDDPRNKLYRGFVRAVEHFKPKIFLMENVPNLISMDNGRLKDEIIKDFENLGYDVKFKILLASDYGVPQSRRRVIMVGMLGENNFSFPEPVFLDNKISTAEAINDLPEGSTEMGAVHLVKPLSEYQIKMRQAEDKIYNHEITNHDTKTISTIALVPDGGNYKDLPIHLQDTRKVNIAWTRHNSKQPSFTIDTGHRHHFHYKYNRIPTVRESARLQSFPDNFIFYGSKTSQYKQVGNAVPPIMAEAIGKELSKALNNSIYKVPHKFYIRLHHIRPRFKNDLESVLLYMASEISKLKGGANDKFAENLNAAIRLYPGNASKTQKTIDNWRTEISSLFGLVEFDGEISKPGQMAKILATKQDLIGFFRYFLFKFQYPGGHLKPHMSASLINANVKFKPTKYLIQVMLEGVKNSENGKFGLSKAEATHCIFNDLRVIRDQRSPVETLKIIMDNRAKNIEYDNSGDVIRYAGDILDYMVLANLVRYRPNGYFYINTHQATIFEAFIGDDSFFQPYEPLYAKEKVLAADVAETQDAWFRHVNTQLDASIFETDALAVIEEMAEENIDRSQFATEMIEHIRNLSEKKAKIKTRDIGNIGEAIIIQHEKTRLSKLDHAKLAKLVNKIPERHAVGYDINSFEGVTELKRLIEVKTTISKGRLKTNNRFHMTTNEWNAASTFGNAYFVYRLMVSSQDISLFLIQNPVQQYKDNKIDMSPRDGVDITYSEEAGMYEAVLV